jgi:hypothetical protein
MLHDLAVQIILISGVTAALAYLIRMAWRTGRKVYQIADMMKALEEKAGGGKDEGGWSDGEESPPSPQL